MAQALFEFAEERRWSVANGAVDSCQLPLPTGEKPVRAIGALPVRSCSGVPTLEF